jgi:hypothetical protein
MEKQEKEKNKIQTAHVIAIHVQCIVNLIAQGPPNYEH